jgi:hypothetical protein
MNNNIENYNINLSDKLFKHLNIPNGFRVKKENVNDKLKLYNHFIINDKVIDEKIFVKFYAYIDPNEKSRKNFTKKNRKQEIKKSAKKRSY